MTVLQETQAPDNPPKVVSNLKSCKTKGTAVAVPDFYCRRQQGSRGPTRSFSFVGGWGSYYAIKRAACGRQPYVYGLRHIVSASSWPLSGQSSLPIIVALYLCLDLGIWIHQVAHGLVMVQGVDDV